MLALKKKDKLVHLLPQQLFPALFHLTPQEKHLLGLKKDRQILST